MGSSSNTKSVTEGLILSGQNNKTVDQVKFNVEAPKLNSPIPGYEILEKIGQGGMGTVYKARQINMDRIVAIKVLRSQFSSQPKIVEKFLQEAKSLARLNHNNITKVISLGQHNGRNYFIMEFVCGSTLYEKLVKNGVFKEKDALSIILQMAEAIRHLNQLGIVHRDIKPSNIILSDQNIPKLSDFGIAISALETEVSTSGLSGTCHYIAPEQALQKEVDVRSDIYSLGATLFHILTGVTPFEGDKSAAIMIKHITEKLRNPKNLNSALSFGVCQLIRKMMEKEPANRYQSPDELIMDIKNIIATGTSSKLLNSRPTIDRSTTSKARTTRRARVASPYSRRNQKLLS